MDIQEAVKSIRNGTIALTTAGVVWLLSVGSVTVDLDRRDAARHLVAWQSLREKFVEFNWSMSESGATNLVTNEQNIDHAWFDRTNDWSKPLTMTVPWPIERTYPLRLRLIDKPLPHGTLKDQELFRVYNIETDSELIPFESYQIVRLIARKKPTVVVLKHDWQDIRELNSLAYPANTKPFKWSVIHSSLRSYGANIEYATELNSSDSAFSKYLDATGKQTTSLFGFKFGSGMFFAGIGIILGGIALTMLGPITFLRRASQNTKSTQPWLGFLDTTVYGSGFLEALAITQGGLALTVPIVILIVQIQSKPPLVGIERWILCANFAGLVASVGVLCFVILESRRVRRSGCYQDGPQENAEPTNPPNKTNPADAKSGAADL